MESFDSSWRSCWKIEGEVAEPGGAGVVEDVDRDGCRREDDAEAEAATSGDTCLMMLLLVAGALVIIGEAGVLVARGMLCANSFAFALSRSSCAALQLACMRA